MVHSNRAPYILVNESVFEVLKLEQPRNRRLIMLSALRKAAIGSIASLAIAMAFAGVSDPASADMRTGGGGGGGFHGGGGGIHSGRGGGARVGGGAAMFHGGGVSGGFHTDRGDGFRRGADFAEGRHDGRFDRDWRDDGFHRGSGFGAVAPLAVVGAYGAYYPNGYGYADNDYSGDVNCIVYRPIYDQYGHYLGRRRVIIC
jgi:hypothetical protein